MEMYCTLRRVSQEKLDSYIQDNHLLLEDFFSNEFREVPQLDIDKSWAGIQYLLEKVSEQQDSGLNLAEIISGNSSIHKIGDSYEERVRYLVPKDVKVLNEELKTLKSEQLRTHFNSKAMLELAIYPGIWQDEHSFAYLSEYFTKLQSFYQHASWANEAVVIMINPS
ncbi:hypothetical protein CHU00_12945 [Sphingobacterium cellulitidis]|uniref:YfbM family protein n=1 Tax=Sphingobacterium cellulitidis TaxID=1768011 RepID=UPI000B945206|nr:YfbM family protein [Sphingobacterium cellulitidis]OYD45150.1 hypothetical protein CHU00_12945 [Sphingobacterium cellulitidis]